jgi:hypothetical protein
VKKLLAESVLAFGVWGFSEGAVRSAQQDPFLTVYYNNGQAVLCREYNTAKGHGVIPCFAGASGALRGPPANRQAQKANARVDITGLHESTRRGHPRLAASPSPQEYRSRRPSSICIYMVGMVTSITKKSSSLFPFPFSLGKIKTAPLPWSSLS